MKFWGGFAFGVIGTVLLLLVIGVYLARDQGERPVSNEDLPGLTVLPEKGECIIKSQVEVFQTLKPNVALARAGVFPDQLLVLLVNHEDNLYYDGQKIKMTQKKCARQFGTYRYETVDGTRKTVPAVVIE